MASNQSALGVDDLECGILDPVFSTYLIDKLRQVQNIGAGMEGRRMGSSMRRNGCERQAMSASGHEVLGLSD